MSAQRSQRTAAPESNFVDTFKGENLTENDIENIWKNLMKPNKQQHGKSTAQVVTMGTSIDTTPTTNYGESHFSLYPETEEEALEQDKRNTKMNTVLKTKKLHPKSYLPQVILYDNVSHERLLSIRLDEIRHAHEAVERRSKRREESFVKSLEKKQQEWMKRDERIIAKLEPENLSEFNFMFGRLYSKPDYPYQTVVQASYHGLPLNRKVDHARRRPKILPQVTHRPVCDDEEIDKTFITKLSKHTASTKHDHDFNCNIKQDTTVRILTKRKEYGRNQSKKKIRVRDWTKDKRFKTLTDILGERYSPSQSQSKPAAPEANRNDQIILSELT